MSDLSFVNENKMEIMTQLMGPLLAEAWRQVDANEGCNSTKLAEGAANLAEEGYKAIMKKCKLKNW